MSHPFKTHRIKILLLSLLTITLTIGLLITPIEKRMSPLTTFQTTEDGVWWAVTTISSVGYGDYYPVSTVGRILGMILELSGVTMFGLIIALVTVELFRNEQMFYWKRTVERFDHIETELEKLRRQHHFNNSDDAKKDVS